MGWIYLLCKVLFTSYHPNIPNSISIHIPTCSTTVRWCFLIWNQEILPCMSGPNIIYTLKVERLREKLFTFWGRTWCYSWTNTFPPTPFNMLTAMLFRSSRYYRMRMPFHSIPKPTGHMMQGLWCRTTTGDLYVVMRTHHNVKISCQSLPSNLFKGGFFRGL